MKINRSMDCVLCLVKQSLDAARYSTQDPDMHAEILEKTMRKTLELGMNCDPTVLGTYVHRIVREVTKDPDPYYKEKKRFNKLAFDHIDQARKQIEEADDQFDTAVRLAIAGNSIDFALGAVDEEKVTAALKSATSQPIVGSIAKLRQAVDEAKTILYLTDNAGEVVYDRLFIELLTSPKFGKNVTVALRGKPILNDALLEDAEEIGLTQIAPCIGNGGDGLGVHFDLTSEEFNEHFINADLIIAKGLANLETLGFRENVYTPKKIAFLYKAKCPFIAAQAEAKLGDLIVKVV